MRPCHACSCDAVRRIRTLGCDFYTTNTHKWLFAPKVRGEATMRAASCHNARLFSRFHAQGTAVLYCDKRHQVTPSEAALPCMSVRLTRY